MVRIKKPTKAEMEQTWKSKDPKALAYEIATFMGGSWPERPVRKVQLSLEGAPSSAEELFEITRLNPTLLSEMTVKTRFLFIEVYLEDIQDLYSQVMETLITNPKTGAMDRCVAASAHRSSAHDWYRLEWALHCVLHPLPPVRRPQPRRHSVTYNSLRKFKHLTISLSFRAVSDVCQEAFDHPDTEMDEWWALPASSPPAAAPSVSAISHILMAPSPPQPPKPSALYPPLPCPGPRSLLTIVPAATVPST